MSKLEGSDNIFLGSIKFKCTKSVIFVSDGEIRYHVNLVFVVLDWDGDAFLAEYTQKFLYDVGNIFLLTS